MLLLANLICSDEACAAESVALVLELADLDRAACGCGCTCVLTGVAEWEPAEVAEPAFVPALAA